MEQNNLLPNNQHGFRSGRSTMTALSAIQLEWTTKSENNLKTGILLWDLSAAFDTLSADIFCKKLEIYGFDKTAVSSFLTGSSQGVIIRVLE